MSDSQNVRPIECRPKLDLDLVGVDGNAFSVLAHFRKQAKIAGWTNTEIKEVWDKATSYDYRNLLNTLLEL